MDNPYLLAFLWLGLALLASLISVRFGLSVVLAEILVGALAGNAAALPRPLGQTSLHPRVQWS